MKESRYNIWTEWQGAFYVFNGVSGSLLRVPASDHSALRSLLAGQVDTTCRPDLLEAMARGRMLLQDEADELAFLARRYCASKADGRSFSFTLVPSLGCNFDCPYCYEAKRPSRMNADVQKAVLSALGERLPGSTGFEAAWVGGEALLAKDVILGLSDAIIDLCNRHQVRYQADLTTNGYLLDRETCAQLRDRQVVGVQVTLDGPPEVHDQMRPLAGGGPTFWRIVENLRHAVDFFKLRVRVNIGTENSDRVEELFQILAREGFAGRLEVYPGQLMGVDDGARSPSAAYRPRCLQSAEFASLALKFMRMAVGYGLANWSLPRPIPTYCSAARVHSLVVGSEGELYKCWESVGNEREVIGDIWHHTQLNGRVAKWLGLDPFADPECRECICLPMCMGGCPHHTMDPALQPNRCGPFRRTYREQILAFVKATESGRETREAAP